MEVLPEGGINLFPIFHQQTLKQSYFFYSDSKKGKSSCLQRNQNEHLLSALWNRNKGR